VYEEAFASGFRRRGIEVIPFRIEPQCESLALKVQRRCLTGPVLGKLNRKFEATVRTERPNAIFLRNPTCIFSSTLGRIRRERPETVLVSYCNDNPFEDGRAWLCWRHYLRNVYHCHINYFFRSSDVNHAKAMGIPNPKLLLSYFVQDLHRPQRWVQPEFRNQVVFSGHYEPDGRHLFLEHLERNGIHVKVFGPRWNELHRRSIVRQQPIRAVWGPEYVQSISGAEIALVFLSGRNRDTYTQRCFEIPACRTLMVAPRTPELRMLFEEDREALYFSTPDQLLSKVRNALADPDWRNRIAEAGYRRCTRDQHSNIKRAAEVLSDIQSHLAERNTRAQELVTSA